MSAAALRIVDGLPKPPRYYIKRHERTGGDSYLHLAIDSGGMSRHWLPRSMRHHADTWDTHPAAVKFMADRLAEVEDINACYVEREDLS